VDPRCPRRESALSSPDLASHAGGGGHRRGYPRRREGREGGTHVDEGIHMSERGGEEAHVVEIPNAGRSVAVQDWRARMSGREGGAHGGCEWRGRVGEGRGRAWGLQVEGKSPGEDRGVRRLSGVRRGAGRVFDLFIYRNDCGLLGWA